MQTKKFLLVGAAAIALFGLFAPTDIGAVLNQCTGGQYTVTFDGQDKVTSPGNVIWKYTIIGNQTSISSFKEAVMIPPRPVAPQDMVPPSIFTYCTERDNNTKINRGNCNGFVYLMTVSKGASPKELKAQVVSSNKVTQAFVSLNVVSGSATSDVCVNTDDAEPKGIPGPGNIGDPFQPIFQQQLVLAAGGQCVANLIFNNGQLTDVTTNTPGCAAGQATNGLFIAGQKVQNNAGPHGLTVGAGTFTCYGPPIPSPPRCVCKIDANTPTCPPPTQ